MSTQYASCEQWAHQLSPKAKHMNEWMNGQFNIGNCEEMCKTQSITCNWKVCNFFFTIFHVPTSNSIHYEIFTFQSCLIISDFIFSFILSFSLFNFATSKLKLKFIICFLYIFKIIGTATSTGSNKVSYNNWFDDFGSTWRGFCCALQRLTTESITFRSGRCNYATCLWIHLWISSGTIFIGSKKKRNYT